MPCIFSRSHPAFQPREVSQDELGPVLRLNIALTVLGIPAGYVAGGIFFTAFALSMGMTKSQFGALATALSLVGLMRLLSPAVQERVGSRKYAWFMLVSASRLVVLPFVLGMFLKLNPWLIVGLVVVRAGLASLAAPLWQSWTWDYVPQRSFASFWAKRKFWVRLAGTCFVLAAAFALDRIPGHYQRQALSCAFTAFIAIGLAQAVLHLRIPEPPAATRGMSSIGKLAEALRSGPFRNLLFLMAMWSFAASICAPFVSPYMLDDLGLRSRLLVAVALTQLVPTFCSLATLRLWGRALDSRHTREAVVVSAAFWAAIPLFYYLATPDEPSFALTMLVAAAVLSGIFPWGFGLAKVLLTVRMSGADKTMPAALMAVVPGLGATLGAALGTFLVAAAGVRGVFIISMAARLVVAFAVWLLLDTGRERAHASA